MSNRQLDRALEWVRRTTYAADGSVPDGELLDRFVDGGDPAAFELLVWRYQRLVFGVCRRILQDCHDAEDAFQATFLILAKKGGSIGNGQSVAAWLHKVASRCALTVRGGRIRRAQREQPLVDDVAKSEAALPPSEQRELRAVLDEELGRLPERFRAPAVLCYLAGRTVDEAAAQLQCPRGTIASRLARARERLRVRLVGRGIAVSTGLIGAALGEAANAGVASEDLIACTIQLAKANATGAAVAANAGALAERVIRAMLLRKLVIGAAIVTAVAGMLFVGGTASLHLFAQTPEAGRADNERAAIDDPQGAAEGQTDKPAAPAFEVFTGTLEPSQTIEIVSRVAGYIEKIHVKEGADVKKGDLLFQIDGRIAQSKLASARAVLAESEARQARAITSFERFVKLLAAKAVSKEEYDQALADVAIAKANLAASQAEVEQARLLLDAHQIVAPISGRIGRFSVNAGSFVAADGAKPLATLVVVEPIALQFNIAERAFLRYQKLKQAGQDKDIEIHFAIAAADDKGFPHKATLDSIRETVDPSTGTVLVRATVPNAERLLLPGMFVRVRIAFPTAKK